MGHINGHLYHMKHQLIYCDERIAKNLWVSAGTASAHAVERCNNVAEEAGECLHVEYGGFVRTSCGADLCTA